jgi:hypothetical protein
VIKIRYADLPGGLHVRVAASGNDTVIYLLPGLTTVQRRAALRRARSTARMGQGPGLPTAGVAGAMIADGIRTTLRNAAAAMRVHPAIVVPPIVIVGVAAIAYVLLVSVSIRDHAPQAGGPGAGSGHPVPQAMAPPLNPAQRPVTRPASATPAGSRHRSPGPSASRHPASASPSPSPGPSVTSPSPESSPSPTPPLEPAPPDSRAPLPSPSAGASVAGTSGSSGGLCVEIGSLGACLSM